MDPKTLSGLDPKLRETYERVMGTSAAMPPQPTTSAPIQADAAPADTSPALSATPTPEPEVPETPMPSEPAPTTEAPASTTPIEPVELSEETKTEEKTQTPTFNDASSPFTQPLPSPASINSDTPQEVSSVVKMLYIFGAVLFFAAYGYFWIRIFNYQLPF